MNTRARRYRREHAAMVRRITAVWTDASAVDLAAGLDWYNVAYATAESLAAGTDGLVTVEQAAGVLAALSPRAYWATNVAWAAHTVEAYTSTDGAGHVPRVSTLNNRATAWAILSGALEGPTGIKTAAFAAAILGDTSAVTVDVWAARAAGIAMPEGKGIGAALYRRIAAAYTDAADRLDVAPRDLQAAVWVAVRGSAS